MRQPLNSVMTLSPANFPSELYGKGSKGKNKNLGSLINANRATEGAPWSPLHLAALGPWPDPALTSHNEPVGRRPVEAGGAGSTGEEVRRRRRGGGGRAGQEGSEETWVRGGGGG
jgi:hypothetical protein